MNDETDHICLYLIQGLPQRYYFIYKKVTLIYLRKYKP